jgi:uncharacterized protein (DUF1684 family)
VRVKHEGDLMGYGTVYHHPEVAANILSFHKLTKRFKLLTYDNKMKDAFIVTRDEGSKNGVYSIRRWFCAIIISI